MAQSHGVDRPQHLGNSLAHGHRSAETPHPWKHGSTGPSYPAGSPPTTGTWSCDTDPPHSSVTPGLTQRQFGKLELRVATAERAMLEVLRYVPHEQSVGDAMALMIGLTTARPAVAQELLEACRSVKAKRLFLLMAKTAGHRWVGKLNLESLDLGNGKRVLGKGGHYYPDYHGPPYVNPYPRESTPQDLRSRVFLHCLYRREPSPRARASHCEES
ncbi:type IV toxin-antitoxin system AbiEi family antitoxin domain-containing protein [Myxococcota bacterium]